MAFESNYGILKRSQKPDKIAGFNLSRKLLSLALMVITVGVFLAFQINTPKVNDDGENLVLDLIAPIGSLFSQVNLVISDFGTYFDNVGKVHNDSWLIGKLYALNKQLQSNNTQLAYENALLREELGLVQRSPIQSVTARVLTHTNNRIIIEGGASKGIKKGAPVITSSGVVGKVERVSNNYSRVIVITSIDSRIPVSIGVNRYNAIISGNNSPAMELSNNEKDDALKDGYLVLTSGRGGVFPYGLLVGHIKGVKVVPAVNLSKLDYVQVITQSVFEQSELDD